MEAYASGLVKGISSAPQSVKACEVKLKATRQGLVIRDALCARSGQEIETEHLFFECEYAKGIWRASGIANAIINSMQSSLEQKIEKCLRICLSSQLTHLQTYLYGYYGDCGRVGIF
ncbi:hypothetical protein YC2023_110338 [Brassica napus]